MIHAMHEAYHQVHRHDDPNDMRNHGRPEERACRSRGPPCGSVRWRSRGSSRSPDSSRRTRSSGARGSYGYVVLWVVSILAAMLTAAYMTRLMVLTFHGENRSGDDARASPPGGSRRDVGPAGHPRRPLGGRRLAADPGGPSGASGGGCAPPLAGAGDGACRHVMMEHGFRQAHTRPRSAGARRRGRIISTLLAAVRGDPDVPGARASAVQSGGRIRSVRRVCGSPLQQVVRRRAVRSRDHPAASRPVARLLEDRGRRHYRRFVECAGLWDLEWWAGLGACSRRVE